MALSEQPPRPTPIARGSGREFVSTHWSVVRLAGASRSPESAAALEKLCRAYWFPLYAFVRREGHEPEDAADLTQEFFSRLIAGNDLASVDRGKGRFRSFLLASMKHLLANEWRRAQRQKRGGGAAHFSLDAAGAEDRYRLDPADELTPERIFDRRWAETVLDAVTGRLQGEFSEAGMSERFDVLKAFLIAGDAAASYAQTAARLNLTESAVKAAIYRLRQRYGELLRAEIAHTVSGPREMQEELRHFLAVLGGP